MRFVKNLLLLGVSSLIALAGLEWGTRWSMPQFDPSGLMIEFHFDEDHVPLGPIGKVGRQWKNTGDFDVEVAFNRYGLRDHKDLAEAGESDLFVVGDSFSLGWGVEERDRYSDVLDEMIPQRVYNISIPSDLRGYALLVDYAERQRGGAPVKRLIVGVCMENDLLDYDALGNVPTQDEPKGILRRAKAWLTTKSALYLALTTVIHQNPRLREIAVQRGLIVDNIAGIRRNQFSPEIVAMTVERVRRLGDGRQMLVLVIPSRGVWVGGNQRNEARLHDELVAALRHAGIDFVDLRPIFEAAGDPIAFHFASDGHWNPKGHAKAAEALFEHLSSARGAGT